MALQPAGDDLKRKDLVFLLILTFAALLIHGYHPYAEDAEIYPPGIEKLLHPELFPFNAQFFEPHAHATLFPRLIAASVRVSHLSLESALLVWQVISIFLLLLACWYLSASCFVNRRARWGSVLMVTVLLTLPIAGTALYVMDQYLNPRNLCAFATIFAIVKTLNRELIQAGLFLIFSALIHPLMSAFAFSFCVLLLLMRAERLRAFAALLPLGMSFAAVPSAYHEVMLRRTYFYVTQWQWYEWLGVIGPAAIFWWFGRIARLREWHNVAWLCRTCVVFEIVYLVAALLLCLPGGLETLARLQPMRSLYVVYVVFLVIAGGVLAEFVSKNQAWRWLALFIPISAGMFTAQRALFAGNPHVEWPGIVVKNPWVEAFIWIRQNTPINAIFALDPAYATLPGEDEQGFRAISRRSSMADDDKDSGAASMFPQLSVAWWTQLEAQSGWSHFQLQDFRSLQSMYGVDWLVLQHDVPGLECPYQNGSVVVCRL